ncbi:MAG: hypothetical protein WBW32_07885 [Luteibacter sp.]
MAVEYRETKVVSSRRSHASSLASPLAPLDDRTMEKQLTHAEHAIEVIQQDMAEVKVDVREVKERLGRIECAVSSIDGKIEGVRDGLESKMEGMREGLEGKMEGMREGLEGKMEGMRDGLESKMDGKIEGLRRSLEAKIDGLEARIDAKIDVIIGMFDNVPTKLQLWRWGSGLLLTMLLLTVGFSSYLLRISGNPAAADAIDAVRGK